MLALLVEASKRAILPDTYKLPVVRTGEALIKILRSGICNTDLEILKGYMGFTGVLGHEFVGVVEDLDENSVNGAIKKGTRVVGEINIACQSCQVCQYGGIMKRNHCPNSTVLGIQGKDGVHAEYVTLPVVNLYPVPDGVTDIQATFTEPLAAAFRIVEQIEFSETDSVAVIGDGKLGLLITEVLCTQSHKELHLFGKHDSKMELVPKMVFKHDISVEDTSSFSNKFDITVEASGTPAGIMMAASLTRPLGTLVLKSTCAAGESNFNTAPFVVKEIKIVGSRCGNFPMAIDALNSGVVNVDKFLTKTYPLSEAVAAIDHASTKGTLKIQLVME